MRIPQQLVVSFNMSLKTRLRRKFKLSITAEFVSESKTNVETRAVDDRQHDADRARVSEPVTD